MKDKSGLEMAITTVIMIILSIAVLAVLIFFFNSQTGFLSKFFGSQTPDSNVDLIVSSCNSLAASEAMFAYCCEEKDVVFSETNENNGLYTCIEAANQGWGQGITELNCPTGLCV